MVALNTLHSALLNIGTEFKLYFDFIFDHYVLYVLIKSYGTYNWGKTLSRLR